MPLQEETIQCVRQYLDSLPIEFVKGRTKSMYMYVHLYTYAVYTYFILFSSLFVCLYFLFFIFSGVWVLDSGFLLLAFGLPYLKCRKYHAKVEILGMIVVPACCT